MPSTIFVPLPKLPLGHSYFEVFLITYRNGTFWTYQSFHFLLKSHSIERCSLRSLAHDRSIVVQWIEAIKTILSLFFFFKKRFHAHKDTHKQKRLTNKAKLSKHLNNKSNNFLCAQTSKRVKVACFAFWCFICTWNLFVKKQTNRLKVVSIASIHYTTIFSINDICFSCSWHSIACF